MKAKIKIMEEASLAQHLTGRILLHLVCLAQDGKWCWHWAGIGREFHAPARLHRISSTLEKMS